MPYRHSSLSCSSTDLAPASSRTTPHGQRGSAPGGGRPLDRRRGYGCPGRAARDRSGGRARRIVGAGGVGKTRLQVAVGYQLIEAFTGAVLFIDLETLSDPSLVTTAIASLLRLPDAPISSPISAINEFF